ncbi:MAG TPA: hypothetical protein VF623_15420 [Segetibacter sp.]|jgi:hypothetical protein
MNAVIKLKSSELNASIIERIQALIQYKENVEITISVDDNVEYFEELNRSIKDLKEGNNLISFTMEELEEYTTR